MTRTEIILKTLVHTQFHRLTWLLARGSSIEFKRNEAVDCVIVHRDCGLGREYYALRLMFIRNYLLLSYCAAKLSVCLLINKVVSFYGFYKFDWLSAT